MISYSLSLIDLNITICITPPPYAHRHTHKQHFQLQLENRDNPESMVEIPYIEEYPVNDKQIHHGKGVLMNDGIVFGNYKFENPLCYVNVAIIDHDETKRCISVFLSPTPIKLTYFLDSDPRSKLDIPLPINGNPVIIGDILNK